MQARTKVAGGNEGPVRRWWIGLGPVHLPVDRTERLRVVVGVGLGLAWTALLSRWLAPWPELPWLVAPFGASAVLVFAVPASPLAQPWAVIVGNTVSVLAGIASVHLGMPAHWAAALAVALAMAGMLGLRCMHPPGGAMALLAVLAHITDWRVALAPVALGSSLLVVAAMVYNPLTRRRYPHPAQAAQAAQAASDSEAADRANFGFSEADVEAALKRYNQVLDVPRDDLRALLESSELEAHRRRMRTVRCRDIMTVQARTAMFGTPLKDAWSLIRRERVKALPVVDRYGHLVGIVTQGDFLRHAGLDQVAGLDRLGAIVRQWLAPTPGSHSDKPEVVGQIMTRKVRVASADRPLGDLLPLFSTEGHHHVPVVGPNNRLLGILTQTDVVAALTRDFDETEVKRAGSANGSRGAARP